METKKVYAVDTERIRTLTKLILSTLTGEESSTQKVRNYYNRVLILCDAYDEMCIGVSNIYRRHIGV